MLDVNQNSIFLDKNRKKLIILSAIIGIGLGLLYGYITNPLTTTEEMSFTIDVNSANPEETIKIR
ncbi:MAG: hypothetical protein ACRESZ_12535 [Methylococcales bacterium]